MTAPSPSLAHRLLKFTCDGLNHALVPCTNGAWKSIWEVIEYHEQEYELTNNIFLFTEYKVFILLLHALINLSKNFPINLS
jgi:hypothetical protein